jgi:predicted HAD superfamily Cof-like phosphohydrolase
MSDLTVGRVEFGSTQFLVRKIARDVAELKARVNADAKDARIAELEAEVAELRAANHSAMVAHWHSRFGVPVEGRPAVPGEKVRALRVELIREEFAEFCDASAAGDIVGVADAIADMLYVVYGAAHAWGIPVGEVFAEVHRSNMSKVWADGTVHRRDDGKVLKPSTYSPANLEPIIRAAMERKA